MVEVFRVKNGASGSGCSCDNGGIPIRNGIESFQTKGVLQNWHGERNNMKSKPMPDK
jgi:hypothetical protein